MSATKTLSERPITLNTKIGDALKEHPSLLEVLVAQSPHFSRLKNPILRRIHGRLVTVAQAASIAGLDPAALVRTLNTAVGLTSDDQSPFTLTSMAGTPEPSWVGTARIATRLDVREDQRNHADPFARRRAEVGAIQDGEVFYLRNTFEPLPLYDVLGKRGFVAWAKQLGPEDWEVYFLKSGKEEAGNTVPESRVAAEAEKIDVNGPTATLTIDVGDLTPPQPMMRILDALASLKPGETLLVHHKRRPAYLYPKLAELGYQHKTVELGPDRVDIYICKG